MQSCRILSCRMHSCRQFRCVTKCDTIACLFLCNNKDSFMMSTMQVSDKAFGAEGRDRVDRAKKYYLSPEASEEYSDEDLPPF